MCSNFNFRGEFFTLLFVLCKFVLKKYGMTFLKPGNFKSVIMIGSV